MNNISTNPNFAAKIHWWLCCQNNIRWYHANMINTVIYARSSADCVTSAEDQIDRLRAIAADQSCTVGGVYSDHPTSVKKTGIVAQVKLRS